MRGASIVGGACRPSALRTQPGLLRTRRCSTGIMRRHLRLGPSLPRPASLAPVAAAASDEIDEHRNMLLFEDLTLDQKKELYTRLCENDVEYNDMKHMCKDNDLGGKDLKYNLRAKLIRRLRELLGMPVWDKTAYGRRLKRPNLMSDVEMMRFYEQRGVVMPQDREEAVGMAFAMLVVDGAMDQDEVPTSSGYDKLTNKDLKVLCADRGLKSTGGKSEMVMRLEDYDKEKEREALKKRAQAAAKQEMAAADIHTPPQPPNRAMAQDLREAQATMVAVKKMGLPELRAALLARRLPVYGTLEVLVERLTTILRRDVIDAHAGVRRMMKYAEAAVAKLNDDQVYEALATRGLVSYSTGEESTARLANSLVDEWVHHAMHPSTAYPDSNGNNGDGYGNVGEEDEESGVGGGPVDPTMDVAVVCGGETAAEREAALAAARAALPQLQSDLVWGTILNSTIAAPVDDASSSDSDSAAAAAAAAAAGPPTDQVGIAFTSPVPNGMAVTVDSPWPPLGCCYVVTATPVDDGSTARTVSAEGRTPDVLVLGLEPRTEYNFTAKLRNAAGDGPESAPHYEATFVRQGVCAKVYYSVPVHINGGQREWRYVQLSWRQLMAATAEELDTRLGAALEEGAEGVRALQLGEVAAGSDVVLPLGLPPGEVEGQGAAACATSWLSRELRSMAASRPEFTRATRALGYSAADLLELPAPSPDDDGAMAAAADGVSAWLLAQGADPRNTRVAVRVESSSCVLAAGVGRGVTQVVEGAAVLAQAHGAPSVVLERVHPGAVFFTVGVLQGEGAPVALVPTEVAYDDLEEEFLASELQLERFIAVQEGQDPEKVDALVALAREEARLHPAVLGDVATPTQRLVHSTPPASLPAATAQQIRTAAAKLFADLGFTDFAQFSGWVVPENPEAAAGLATAMQLRTAAAEAEASGTAEADVPRPMGRPFADLAAIDAEERAALAAEAGAAAVGMSAADKSGAVDVEVYTYAADDDEPDAALANGPVMRELGEGVESLPVQYGTFAGIELDDRTRQDLKDARVLPPNETIPESLPSVAMPSALPDLAAVSAGDVTRTTDGASISFNQVQLTPDLGHRLSPLAQQLAVAGIPIQSLPRHLVSRAATRAGLPPLPPHAGSIEDPETAEDVWPPSLGQETAAAAAAAAAPPETSMEEIEAAIESWSLPDPLPAPESYDDIRSGDESDGSASDAEAEAAATAAGLDADAAVAATLERSSAALNRDGPEEESSDEDTPVPVSDADILSQQFPGLHPTRQRVWILCGGEGPQRDASLSAAMHAMASLQGAPDLLIETFFLDPPTAGLKDTERRRTLLQRRVDLLKLGATDDELLEDMPEFHPSRIRYPTPPLPQDLALRGIWRLSGSTVVRSSVPDMRDGCEAALTAATTAAISRREGDTLHGTQQLLATTRGELELAGMPPGGPAPWGGNLSQPRAPEFSFLAEWVEAAAQQCVVVLLALPGHPSAQGPLQQLLESRGVPFTGPTHISADLCADRPELLGTLAKTLRYEGSMINMPLVHTLSAPELGALGDSERAADDFFGHLFGDWQGKMLTIRPAREAGQLGVARVACGADIRVYAAAVRQWTDAVPAGELSVELEDVPMLLPPPTQFIVEPILPATPLQLRVDAAPGEAGALVASGAAAAVEDAALESRLSWPTSDSWLEVRACLLGDIGAMRCLGLTTSVIEIATGPGGEDVVVGSFDLTPPPAAVLHPATAADAHARMALIADRLGLSGAAIVTAMISAANGEIVVLGVDANPDIGPEGLLMRQAAAAAYNPLEPKEVLRELLKLGMSRGEGGGGDGSGGGGDAAGYPGDEYLKEASLAMDGKDPPSPAQDYYGDMYIKIDAAFVESDDDDDDDEDGDEGAAYGAAAEGPMGEEYSTMYGAAGDAELYEDPVADAFDDILEEE